MHFRRAYCFEARGRSLKLGPVTRIMGILNVTRDSFSGDGILRNKNRSLQVALRIARRMIKAGADIIDVGGESSRPGADPISVREEILRVVPIIRLLAEKTDAIISVDTYKPGVAAAALKAGAHVLNVIHGTPVSDKLIRLCKKYQAGIILMHMRGTPGTMQGLTKYRDVVAEVALELEKSVAKCRRFGLNEHAVAVDPGIGFAKTAEQNLQLLRGLANLGRLDCPVLVGTSRKSFIGRVLGLEVNQRMMGTAATVACAVLGGAQMVRVHDVAAMRQVVKMVDAIINPNIEIAK